MKKRGTKIIVAAIIYILALILPFPNEFIVTEIKGSKHIDFIVTFLL